MACHIAESAGDVLAQIPGRIDPPEDFGVAWVHQGERTRFGHVMDLWVATATSDAYRIAWKREREALGVAGYSWTDKAKSDAMPFAMPCWWERRDIPLDRAALRTAVKRALAHEAERAANQEAERIRREAEEDARIGARVAVIRARLEALLASSAW